MTDKNRRSFLMQSLATAGMVAADWKMFASPPKKKLRVAIIGCDRLG